jgi:hypothetical protein
MHALHNPVQFKKDGFGRPFFRSLVQLGLLVVTQGCMPGAQAQELIYRCGNEYTNAPRDVSQCERLTQQAVTVIPGVLPLSSVALVQLGGQASEAARKPQGATPATRVPQNERDVHARTILIQELERVQKQHQAWVQEYKAGAPLKLTTEQTAPQQYAARVATLKAAIERAERDMNSLQRELAARPLAEKTVKP